MLPTKRLSWGSFQKFSHACLNLERYEPSINLTGIKEGLDIEVTKCIASFVVYENLLVLCFVTLLDRFLPDLTYQILPFSTHADVRTILIVCIPFKFSQQSFQPRYSPFMLQCRQPFSIECSNYSFRFDEAQVQAQFRRRAAW